MGADGALVLFDDERARQWSPFAEVRPVGELRFGASLLRERVESVSGRRCIGHLSGLGLLGWDEPGAPPVVAPETVSGAVHRLVWSSRAVPRAIPDFAGDRVGVLRVGDVVVGWALPPGRPLPTAAQLLRPDEADLEGEVIQVEADLLDWPWDLVARSADQLQLDLATAAHRTDPGRWPGVYATGEHGLFAAPDAQIGPGVVLDLRSGSIRLGEGVQVEGPARLVGPLHLGAHSVVFGGSLARVATGPHCKLRGEIADSIFLGYANKAHDGYLGHALVGRWVNLGAGTTNSDLKNSYGSVRVELATGRIDSGLLKVGAFLGDHVKTGIGTLLTTGAVVGAGSNVFGGARVSPAALPPFTWAGPEGTEPVRLDRFFAIARTAMARRGHAPTPGVAATLRRLWDRTHAG